MDRFPLLAPQAEGTLPSNLTTKDVMCGIIDGNLVICFFFPETLFRTHFFASFFVFLEDDWKKTVMVFIS